MDFFESTENSRIMDVIKIFVQYGFDIYENSPFCLRGAVNLKQLFTVYLSGLFINGM